LGQPEEERAGGFGTRVVARRNLKVARKPYWGPSQGRRVRMGRTPAEIAEGAEGYWEW